MAAAAPAAAAAAAAAPAAAAAAPAQFVLPALPYAKDALQPHISAATLEFHYGKHHAGYVTILNDIAKADAKLQGKTVDELVQTLDAGRPFNMAAQIWNHTFYWNSMAPKGGGEPNGAIAKAIDASFGSFAKFKEEFSAAAGGHFGSGWAWLVFDGGKLKVVQTHDAGCPLSKSAQTGGGGKPILTCDVWEHAYYIDYKNARPQYVAAWWNLINWEFANQNLEKYSKL